MPSPRLYILGKMLPKLFCTALALALTVGTAPATAYSLDPNDYDAADVIHRDVVVIGGGSSGTYTAVRLKDSGKSVVVVEKEAKLGGHAQTYTAPNGYTVDYGVIVFAHSKYVNDYFSRFNISLVAAGNGALSGYWDFATGRPVTPPVQNATAVAAAFEAYAAQLEKYPELQQGFNLTYPVASELLLTFGEFVRKHGLQALVPTIFITNQGYAPILQIPMLYMFKYLNAGQLNSIAKGYQTTADHDIYALYAAAGAYIGASSVLTLSTPLAMNRTSSPVRVLVQTPTGNKLIVATKLVSTIPPTLHKLAAYDLSAQEKSLFRQWQANGYYTGILSGTNLPSNLSLAGAQAGRPYDIPAGPGLYTLSINAAADDIAQVYYGSATVQSDAAVKAAIEAAIAKVQAAQGVAVAKPKWAVFSSHAPFNLEVSNEAIKGGFYRQLLALQGQRNTFYNGAAWMAQDSSAIWQYTDETVVPEILGAL